MTSLSTYIVTLISRSHALATMVNGYDVKTSVGHDESNSYRLRRGEYLKGTGRAISAGAPGGAPLPWFLVRGWPRLASLARSGAVKP